MYLGVGWVMVAHVGLGGHVCVGAYGERPSWDVYDARTHTNAPDCDIQG